MIGRCLVDTLIYDHRSVGDGARSFGGAEELDDYIVYFDKYTIFFSFLPIIFTERHLLLMMMRGDVAAEMSISNE